jgi:hypothetical protein
MSEDDAEVASYAAPDTETSKIPNFLGKIRRSLDIVFVLIFLFSLSPNCNHLRSPGIDSDSLCSLAAGTSNRVVVLARQAGSRFLGSLKGLKIRAQEWNFLGACALRNNSEQILWKFFKIIFVHLQYLNVKLLKYI